jgi:hypothetical protein
MTIKPKKKIAKKVTIKKKGKKSLSTKKVVRKAKKISIRRKNPEKTINDFILEKAEKRLNDLIRIEAPDVLLENQKRIIANIKSGQFKMKGLTEYGNLIILTGHNRKGRGGVPYILFETNDGEVFYFPQGKFGPFLSK